MRPSWHFKDRVARNRTHDPVQIVSVESVHVSPKRGMTGRHRSLSGPNRSYLTKYQDGHPDFWLNTIFGGNRRHDYEVHAIIVSFVRFTEAACAPYSQGQQHIEILWKDDQSLRIGDHNLAGTLFEDCINLMDRPRRRMKAIRGN